MAGTEGGAKLDEDLQSRQMAVYGRESMLKLSTARVLIAGLNGLGAETAKNVILANVKSVTLQDTKAVQPADLGSNFYLSEKDVGKNRAASCQAQFQELNPAVSIEVKDTPLTAESVAGYSMVVLCDSSIEEAILVNDACRAAPAPAPHFIYGACNGVFGHTFCDYGPEFVCSDTTGEALKTAIIHKIEKSEAGKQALVQCVQDEDIDFDDGDYITFTEVKGMTQLNGGKPQQIYDVSKGKKQFKIADTSAFGEHVSGGIATETKMLKILKFRSLRECLAEPGQMHDSDTSKQSAKAKAFDEAVFEHFGKPEFEKKFGRSGLALLALRAADSLGSAALHAADGPAQAAAAARKLNGELPDASRVEELEDRIATVEQYARGYGAVLNPFAAIFGGVMGQEVIKACTGKFHPTFQWYHHDCEEALPAEVPAPLADEHKQSRYAAQLQVFGSAMQEKLAALNVFLVGSGALGCEFLKNFALMGISCDKGRTTVTDDDTIEKSNLSRQFLFRNHNIGHSKSESASGVAKVMNPAFNVLALTERVQPSTENVFSESFWDEINLVVNALDNVKARLYVDAKCVLHTKPLLESGTLGPKSNTQCIVPFKTENYGATRDPPEKEAPQCALHNFPHNIDHCLGLARSEFVGNFETVPTDANEFAKGGEAFVNNLVKANENIEAIFDKLSGDPKFNCAMSGGLMDAIVDERPTTFDDCVAWARKKYETYFVDRVKLLVYNCPEEMTTDAGTPFWAPPKRFPKVVEFDSGDAMAMKFLVAASNLRAQMYNIAGEQRDPAYVMSEEEKSQQQPHPPPHRYFKEALKKVTVTTFQPFKTKVKTEADEAGEAATEEVQAESGDDDRKRVDDARAAIDAALAASALPKPLLVNEFEKDQDLNFHIDFIQSFANLRARNYVIDEVDFLQVLCPLSLSLSLSPSQLPNKPSLPAGQAEGRPDHPRHRHGHRARHRLRLPGAVQGRRREERRPVPQHLQQPCPPALLPVRACPARCPQERLSLRRRHADGRRRGGGAGPADCVGHDCDQGEEGHHDCGPRQVVQGREAAVARGLGLHCDGQDGLLCPVEA